MTDHLCAIVPVTHPLADKNGLLWKKCQRILSHAGKGSAGREILDAGFELKI